MVGLVVDKLINVDSIHVRLSSAVGRALRAPLKAIPKDAVVPILLGPNRGLRWVAGSHTHGCWLGWYEATNAKLLARLCKPDMLAFDVGANAGYFSLLFSRRVRHVIAFDIDTAPLKRTLALNRIGNVQTVMGNVGYSVRLDDYPTPDLVKMDIEGAEVAALTGAQRILAERKTTWLIELHDTHNACLRMLSGYNLTEIGPTHILATPPL